MNINELVENGQIPKQGPLLGVVAHAIPLAAPALEARSTATSTILGGGGRKGQCQLRTAHAVESAVHAGCELCPPHLGQHKQLRLSLSSTDKCTIVVSLGLWGKPGCVCALDVKGCAYQVRQATSPRALDLSPRTL